jgi:type VI secretion system protein ImpF
VTVPGEDIGPQSRRAATFEPPVQLSVLDRLVDETPRVPAERPQTREESVQALQAGVRRHLEWLLNTRRSLVTVAPELTEVQLSLLRFGLPDLSSLPRTRDAQARLARGIAEVIALFEPRLRGVRVTPVDPPTDAGLRAEIRFKIEARLRMESAPEGVAFDGVFDFRLGGYRVGGAGSDA